MTIEPTMTIRSFVLSLVLGAGFALALDSVSPAADPPGDGDFSLASRGIDTEEPLSFILDGVPTRTFAIPAERSVSEVEPCQKQGNFPRQKTSTLSEVKFDPVSGLKITFEKTIYADWPGVIEWVAWFENASDHDTPNLKDLAACDVVFQVGDDPDLWHGIGEHFDPKLNYSGKWEKLLPDQPISEVSEQGYPSFGAFPYFRLRGSQRAYTIAIGWTGGWRAVFRQHAGGVRLHVDQYPTIDLYLKPGEKIRTPRITVLSYNPDDDPINLWRHWYRQYIMPRQAQPICAANVDPGADARYDVLPPKLILDAHQGGELYIDITEESEIAAIRRARELKLPIEGLWIDAGWYLRRGVEKTSIGAYWFRTGEWLADPERFPRGMKPLADELGPEGNFTLWFEPERVYKESPGLPQIQPFVVPNIEYADSYRLDMTRPETVDFLSNLIGGKIKEYGVTIYRQDSNGAGPGMYLEEFEKTEPRFVGRRGLAMNLYVQGYYTFWQNIKKMNPGLIFDTCASGGRRNDLDTLRLGAVPLHYSDVGWEKGLENQQYHDMLDQWFIYYKNIDQFDQKAGGSGHDFYRVAIDLAPFTTVSMGTLNDSEDTRKYVGQFMAVRDFFISGDYYLLRGNFTEDDWFVAQFHDPQKDAGFMRVVRNADNNEPDIMVTMKGLTPDAEYTIHYYDTDEEETFTGKKLMTEGLKLILEPRAGAIVRYETK